MAATHAAAEAGAPSPPSQQSLRCLVITVQVRKHAGEGAGVEGLRRSQGMWGLCSRVTHKPRDEVLRARATGGVSATGWAPRRQTAAAASAPQCGGTDRVPGETPDVPASPPLVPVWPYSGRV